MVGRGNVSYTFTYQQFRAMRRDNDVMTDLAAYSPVRLNVSIDGSVEPTTDGQMVSGTYFSILGVNPVIGRPIGAEDDAAINAHPVAMISYGYWTRRFDSRAHWCVGQDRSRCPAAPLHDHRRDAAGILRASKSGWRPTSSCRVMMQPTLVQAQENLLADRPALYHTWLRVFGRLGQA